MKPRVAVIGAGMVGASIAYALAKRGASVTLIDRDAPGHGCSYGNSGAISPASIAPVAMPGVLASVPSMLMDPESPLFLPLAYLPRALPWLARFVASASPKRVAVTAKKLADLHAGSIDAHLALSREVGVPELILRGGHLHLYPDEAALAKDAGGWKLREQYGYKFERLGRTALHTLEPRVGKRYQIGIFLADHATILNPLRYVEAIVRAYAALGGKVERGLVGAVSQRPDGRWSVDADGAPALFDHVVVAAGIWSRRLLEPLGIRLQLESQRGYHVQFAGGTKIVSRTVILADKKIFLTPMEGGLRVGGTVEIGGIDRAPDPHRAAILEKIARENIDGLEGLSVQTWMGHRPCMPDSVPVIGPAAGRPGLWLAVGHGHLGMTDSPNTAKRIAEAMLPA